MATVTSAVHDRVVVLAVVRCGSSSRTQQQQQKRHRRLEDTRNAQARNARVVHSIPVTTSLLLHDWADPTLATLLTAVEALSSAQAWVNSLWASTNVLCAQVMTFAFTMPSVGQEKN